MSFWKRLWQRPEEKLTIRQIYHKMTSEQEAYLMDLETYPDRKRYIEETFPVDSFSTVTDMKLIEEMLTPVVLPVYSAHMSYRSIFTMFQNYRNIAETTSQAMTFSEKRQFLNGTEVERQALMKTLTGQDVPALTKVLVEQVTKDINRELAKEQRDSGGSIGFISYYGSSGEGDSSSDGGAGLDGDGF